MDGQDVMGLLLHLTDLHLGPRGADTTTADTKVRVVPEAELETRLSAARGTLRQIASRMAGKRFSAVVISGDITLRNTLEGFDALKTFLDQFKQVLPGDPRAIIVVPGNHDVDWNQQPSTSQRYINFKRAVRDGLGATTPFLEGLDDLGSTDWASNKAAHYWIEPDEGWAVVPLNSCNYCGSNAVIEDLTDSELTEFAAATTSIPKAKDVLVALKRLRQFDIARISPNQFEAFRSLVRAAETDLASGAGPHSGRPPLLVGVTHHHLLPVSDDEEIKPFESFTNLGKLRDELWESGIHLLLHGHKHKLAAYWDRQDVPGRPSHDLLVLSGASIGGEGYDKKNPCRIVEIRAVAGGQAVKIMSAEEFLSKTDQATVKASHLFGNWMVRAEKGGDTVTVLGKNFDEAYARIQSLPVFESDASTSVLYNVMVQIADGRTVEDRAPAHYPQDVVDDPASLDAWFVDIANWWQRELSELPADLYFTHGMRIKKYDGVLDQLEHAVEVLKERDPANGRAVVTLIDPEFDFRRGGRKKLAGWFPAFAMAQIHYTRRGQKDYLNVVGFFRKQELKYWWAINVRELGLILDELRHRGVKGEIGSITTIATVAVVENGRPRVAVPALDRWYDVDKSRIADLVTSIVEACNAPGQSPTEARAKLALWREVLIDLVPADVPISRRLDNIPLTTKGLDLTNILLQAFAKHRPSGKLLEIRELLNDVREEHQNLRDIIVNLPDDRDRRQRFSEIRTSLKSGVAKLRGAIEEVLI